MAKKDMKTQVDTMDSPERLEQLEKIDRLREFGVGEEINLPQVSILPQSLTNRLAFTYICSQLVVVGDQSSGKSSLLEGLTGLPFPVASELCTRFATQIVFRRSHDAEESLQSPSYRLRMPTM